MSQHENRPASRRGGKDGTGRKRTPSYGALEFAEGRVNAERELVFPQVMEEQERQQQQRQQQRQQQQQKQNQQQKQQQQQPSDPADGGDTGHPKKKVRVKHKSDTPLFVPALKPTASRRRLRAGTGSGSGSNGSRSAGGPLEQATRLQGGNRRGGGSGGGSGSGSGSGRQRYSQPRTQQQQQSPKARTKKTTRREDVPQAKSDSNSDSNSGSGSDSGRELESEPEGGGGPCLLEQETSHHRFLSAGLSVTRPIKQNLSSVMMCVKNVLSPSSTSTSTSTRTRKRNRSFYRSNNQKGVLGKTFSSPPTKKTKKKKKRSSDATAAIDLCGSDEATVHSPTPTDTTSTTTGEEELPHTRSATKRTNGWTTRAAHPYDQEAESHQDADQDPHEGSSSSSLSSSLSNEGAMLNARYHRHPSSSPSSPVTTFNKRRRSKPSSCSSEEEDVVIQGGRPAVDFSTYCPGNIAGYQKSSLQPQSQRTQSQSEQDRRQQRPIALDDDSGEKKSKTICHLPDDDDATPTPTSKDMGRIPRKSYTKNRKNKSPPKATVALATLQLEYQSDVHRHEYNTARHPSDDSHVVHPRGPAPKEPPTESLPSDLRVGIDGGGSPSTLLNRSTGTRQQERASKLVGHTRQPHSNSTMPAKSFGQKKDSSDLRVGVGKEMPSSSLEEQEFEQEEASVHSVETLDQYQVKTKKKYKKKKQAQSPSLSTRDYVEDLVEKTRNTGLMEHLPASQPRPRNWHTREDNEGDGSDCQTEARLKMKKKSPYFSKNCDRPKPLASTVGLTLFTKANNKTKGATDTVTTTIASANGAGVVTSSGTKKIINKAAVRRKLSSKIVAGATLQPRHNSNKKSQDDDDYVDSKDHDYKDRFLDNCPGTRYRTRGHRQKRINRPLDAAPETIEIDSDSDIEEVEGPSDPLMDFELARIAVGKKVYSHECHAVLNQNKFQVDLHMKKQVRRRAGKTQNITLCLKDGTLEAFRYYIAPADGGPAMIVIPHSNDDYDYDKEERRQVHINSFISLRIKPTDENQLTYFTTSYASDVTNDPALQSVVLEFRHSEDVQTLVDCCRLGLEHSGIHVEEVTEDTCYNVSKSLIDNGAHRKNPRVRNLFIDGRQQDHILLVYPFAGDPKQIEHASEGLTEASGAAEVGDSSSDESDDNDDKSEPTHSPKESSEVIQNLKNRLKKPDGEPAEGKARQRAHHVSIRVEDYDRLDPCAWLNDSLVDFWMQWISRDDTTLASKFHFFTSHFFSTLSNDGADAVASWTKRKKINIFQKKLIFIPINEDLHWSLCVVVNPGALIDNMKKGRATKDDPLSCMIFLDSLQMHNKGKVANHVRRWLNSQWKIMSGALGAETTEQPFDKNSFRLFNPKVPYQNNTYDCGVFVCRYAYALYELRTRRFTFADAGMYCSDVDEKTRHGTTNSRTKRRGAFYQLISDGAEFDFNMSDIARFREEFRTLIERLSKTYLDFKRREKEEERQRKIQAATEKAEASSKPEAESSSKEVYGPSTKPVAANNHPGAEKENNLKDSSPVVFPHPGSAFAAQETKKWSPLEKRSDFMEQVLGTGSSVTI